jgi:integrase
MSARPQPRKPWFHAPSGFWCAQIAGKRHYLDRDPVVAQRKLKELLQDQKRGDANHRAWLDAPFCDLADEFLEDVKARRARATYSSYQEMLELAMRHLGTGLRVGDVHKFHLTKVEQALHGSYSSTTVFKCLHAVQRVFAWAVENELLDVGCLIAYKKPRPRERTRVITPDEFQAMLRGSGAPFRRLLLALRLCGCRPGELRQLVWEEVRLEQGVLIIPVHKTLTRQKHPRPRIVPLPEPIMKLIHWLGRNPHGAKGHVFLNTDGNPWTRTALHSQMRRLRERVGLKAKAGENIVLYSNRHTYGTENVGKVSDIELAELMGHTDTGTTRRYVHLNLERLRQKSGAPSSDPEAGCSGLARSFGKCFNAGSESSLLRGAFGLAGSVFLRVTTQSLVSAWTTEASGILVTAP